MDTYWQENLEKRVSRLLQSGESVALVTIIARSGSTPRGAGTRALQTNHAFEGTVGGGLLEAQTMRAAQDALASGRSCRARFDLAGKLADSDMICGGGMEVLCEILCPEQASMFALADTILASGAGQAFWQVRIREDGPSLAIERQLYVQPSPVLPEELPTGVQPGLDAVLPLFAGRKPRPQLLRGEAGDIYLEPLTAPPVLLLVGGGHVSLCVAQLAQACDFVVDVVDDREEFANSGRFPMARHCLALPNYENLAQACGIGPNHFVAIMTRGHAFDRETLAQILPARPRYLGMIGSRTKRDQIYDFLRQQGVGEKELARVRCPIGLKIEAETPQQIAVSVVAELLAEKQGTLDCLRAC